MAPGTLYTYPDNFRAFKGLIAAQFSGAKVEVAKDFSFGATNKKPDFLKKFPSGQVPAFETTDGVRLVDSNAIALYLANEQLRGKTLQDQAEVIQWISIADNEILNAVRCWVYPVAGIMQLSQEDQDRGQQGVKSALSRLDAHLLTKTYLVGERITLADIAVFCTLLQAFQWVLDPATRAPYVNVNRWVDTLVNQPQFKAVLGDFHLCEKSGQRVGGGAAAGGQAKGGAAHKKKDKKSKDKKEKKPAASPVPPADDAGDEMDDLGLEKAAPSKDPFEQFPKGNWNMDDFKRFYSNNPEDQAIKYFWEKFDQENYSMWFCEYKYPEDLTMVFMSCNLMSGMMQRLDKMRKNAFGSLLLFGEDNKSQICGLWVWKGHELAFKLSSDWQVDYESYEWKKLDPKDEQTKKLVTQYFVWEGEHKGLKYNQGKVFK
jgi:elongation factor 1-gamma